MAENETPPAVPPANTSAQPGAGNSPAAQPAAEAPPAWAQGLISQLKEVRTGLGRQGERQKALEAQLAQAQQYAPSQQFGTTDPYADPFGNQGTSIGDMTPQQLRAMVAQQAQEIATEQIRANNAALSDYYPLESLRQAQAVKGVNDYAASEGLPTLPPDVVQQHSARAQEILAAMGAQTTPQAAYQAIKFAASEASANLTAAAAATRAGQVAQTNATSAALPNQTGSAAAPPPPDGGPPMSKKEALTAHFMDTVIKPHLEDIE